MKIKNWKELNSYKKTITFSITLIGVFFSIFYLIKVNQIDINKEKWLYLSPIQCLGNAWEFEWLKKHPGQYNNYPFKNPLTLDPEEEIILKDFYQSKDIKIISTKSEIIKDKTDCNGCSCPQGYILSVLISENDAEKMIKNGWTLKNEK